MRASRHSALVLLALGLLGSAAQAGPLRVAVEGDGAYAPFSFFKEDKTLTGFDIELTDALCKHIPEGCEIIPTTFESIVDDMASGKYDVSISSMGLTPEREKKILYGPMYYRSHTIFIGRPDAFSETSPEALKGVRLASAQGTMQQQYLVATYPRSTILEGKDIDDAYNKLVDGSVDLVLADAIVQMNFLQSERGSKFAFVGQPLRADIFNSASYITFHKGLEAKSDEFAEALKHLRLDGTYDSINRKFIPFNIY